MQRLLFCVVALAIFAALTPPTDAQTDNARLPAPLYPDVIALWEAGKPAEALAALARRAPGTDGDAPLRHPSAAAALGTPLEVLMLRARLLAAAGEHRQSAALWQEVGTRSSSLESLALREAVGSLVQRGEPQRAESLVTGRATREFGNQFAAIATAYRVAGQLDRAAVLYRRVIASPPSGSVADEASLGLAVTLEQAGDRSAALSLLRDLQLRFREAGTFGRARGHALRLADALDRPIQPFTEAEYARLADRLRELSMYDDGLAVLEEWKKAYPPAAARIDYLITDTLYRARRDGEARRRADAYLERYPDSSHSPDIRILQYRLDVREGRTDGVRSRGRRLWTGAVPGIPLEERLSLGRLLAAYLVSVGEVAEGLDMYEQVYRASTSREMRTDVLWRSAVASIRAGQLDRAESTLQNLRRLRPGPDTSRLADYWSAAIAERRHRLGAAVASFTALARREPYHYYGIRAREQLAALKATIPTPRAQRSFPSLTLRDETRETRGFQAAALLARAGLKAEAAQAARDLAADARNDPALALLAARALDEAGRYRQSVGLIESRFNAFLQQPASGLPVDFWRLAYPRAFWEDVRSVAEAARVDPLLLLALARQESRYDPSVRSLVGAIGLFQIMPYTADALASSLGINVADRTPLFRPRVSARFAARLVADHLREFDDSAVAVMAAYNAGEDRAEDWWKAARGGTEDLFVDTIPYTETRTYVRIVYANYVMYRELYGRN